MFIQENLILQVNYLKQSAGLLRIKTDWNNELNLNNCLISRINWNICFIEIKRFFLIKCLEMNCGLINWLTSPRLGARAGGLRSDLASLIPKKL